MRIDFEETHPFLAMNASAPPFPMIPVSLIGRRGLSVETCALLDSGADETMFHAMWAAPIGLDFRSGKYGEMGGISSGHPVTGYTHRVQIRIGLSAPIPCNIFFSDEIGQEWDDQLIGRQTIFRRLRFGLRGRTELTYVGRER